MEFASKGVGAAGLTTGIIGSALGALNSGLLGGVFNGWGNGAPGGCAGYGAHGFDHPIDRYDAAQQARIAELETEVKLRDANTYTLNEMGKLRDYVDRRFDGVNGQLCAQAVTNSQIAANIGCMQGEIAALKGLTKTIVPISNICPEPMARYNSFVVPTETATPGA